MDRRDTLMALGGLIYALTLGACSTATLQPSATAAGHTPLPAATGIPTETAEPILVKPSTPTPGLPTPVSEPAAHLPAGTPVVVQTIRMVDRLAGWAIARASDGLDRVARTADGGRSWKDVTPPEWLGLPDDPRRATLAEGADPQRAWIVYSGAFDPEGGPIAVVVWRTADAGATWLPSTPIEAPAGSGWFELVAFGALNDGFGWLMAAVDAGMMHQYIALYTTQDSGATWSRVLDPYGDQPVQSCPKTGLAFADPSAGWMTRDCGGLIDQVTVITTDDGGLTWKERPVPAPPGLPEGFAYPYLCSAHSIRMDGPRSGLAAVSCFQYLDTPAPDGNTRSDGPHALVRTEDGGATWTENEYPGGALLWLDTSRGWALGRDLYRTGDGGATWQFVHSVSWDGQFSFVDETYGWAVARNDQATALVQTADGGMSWSILRPVTAP